VGDSAPRLKVFKWIKGKELRGLTKGRVYVVEFGATWCKPCAEAIPKLTELQKKYARQVSILGLFVMEYNREADTVKDPKYVSTVKAYVSRLGSKLTYLAAVDDPRESMANAWIRAAGFSGIPRTFVVDRAGKIAWIGNNPQKLDSILSFVISKQYKLSALVDDFRRKRLSKVPWNPDKLLLINGNGGNDSNFLFRSILTYSKGEVPAGHPQFISNWMAVEVEEGAKEEAFAPYRARVQVMNGSLTELYYMAYGDTLLNGDWGRGPKTDKYPDTVKYPGLKISYGKYWPKPILEVSDSSMFTSTAPRFNYSLKVPLQMGSAKFMQKAMVRDLSTYFGYYVVVEKRMMPCWKLTTVGNASMELRTKTPGAVYRGEEIPNGYAYHNAEIRDLIRRFITNYGEGFVSPTRAITAPFIDETGIGSEIDYSITDEEFTKMTKGDFEAGKAFLKRLGLNLEKGETEMSVVVIRDSKTFGGFQQMTHKQQNRESSPHL
jgi:thiol-disulfide isomerase/thioredoxin